MAGVFKSLDRSDVRLVPFKTHKQWPDTIVNGVSGSVYTIYQADYNPLSNHISVDPLDDAFDLGNPAFTSTEPTTSNGQYQRVVHSSIDHLYYRDYYTNNKASFGSGNINYQIRFLEDKAQVISMPQSKFGEAIQPGSVQMVMSWSFALASGSDWYRYAIATYGSPTVYGSSPVASGSWVIVDDTFGNLVISGSSYLSPYGQYVGGAYTNYSSSVDKVVAGEWPLDETYKYVDAGIVNIKSDFNRGQWNMRSIYTNVEIKTPTGSTQPDPTDVELMGAMMHFTSSLSSSITIKPNEVSEYSNLYNFQDNDFSISMFVQPSALPAVGGSTLIAKRGPVENIRVDENGNVFSQVESNQYPYALYYATGSKKVTFQKGGGSSGTFTLTSSVALDPGVMYHVAVVRSGSMYTLYVNSGFSSSINTQSTAIRERDCMNSANITIGNLWYGSRGFNGYIDNVKIYKEALTQNDVNILHHTLGVGNLNIGNAFYNNGMMTLTSIPSRYATLQTITTRGTHTIWETEVSCTVGPGEFTRSNNPTLQTYEPSQNQYVFSSFATASNFSPFVTTVGLYDDYHRMVAVAKLSTPIQLPNNTDTTIIVRFDR